MADSPSSINSRVDVDCPKLTPSLYRFRLRSTLVLPFLVEIIATVGLVGWLSFRSGQEAVRDLATQLRNEVGARVSDRVQSYVSMPPLVNQVNVNAMDLGMISFKDSQSMTAATPYFWRQVLTYPNIGFVGFANRDGQYLRVGWINRLSQSEKPQIAQQLIPGGGSLNYYNIDSSGRPTQLAKSQPNYDVRQRPFYQVVVKKGKASWSEIFINFANPTLQINASTPYYDRNGNLLGILTSQMGLGQIRDFLQTIKIGKTGQVFIVEPNGKLVATSLRDQPLWLERSPQKLERVRAIDSSNPLLKSSLSFLYETFGDLTHIDRTHQLEFMLEGQRQFLQAVPLKDRYGLNWLIVIAVPESDFMAQIDRNIRNTLILCLAALLATIFIGILTARWIVQPIRHIGFAAGEIARGDRARRASGSAIIEIDRLAESFNSMAAQLQQSFEELEQRVDKRTAELRKEKERSELLLLNILPGKIADQLKDSNQSPAEHFEEATILFADIVGFTTLATRLSPLELINCLNQVFSHFDRLAEQYNLEKIKTIGDAYMAVGGVPIAKPDHAESVADMALDMQRTIAHWPTQAGETLQIRIGINTGPVIAGVIGTKKFIYDLWGDAVNIASRMESHGEPNRIQVTDATYEKLKDRYQFEPRGTVAVKGRGEMMTYWLLGKHDDNNQVK